MAMKLRDAAGMVSLATLLVLVGSTGCVESGHHENGDCVVEARWAGVVQKRRRTSKRTRTKRWRMPYGIHNALSLMHVQMMQEAQGEAMIGTW